MSLISAKVHKRKCSETLALSVVVAGVAVSLWNLLSLFGIVAGFIVFVVTIFEVVWRGESVGSDGVHF